MKTANRRQSAKANPGIFDLYETGAGCYELRGELTFATASAALAATAPLFAGATGLRFDLAGIARADSAGVALLVEWLRRAQRSGGIRYAHLPDSLRAMARVSGVEHLLPVEP